VSAGVAKFSDSTDALWAAVATPTVASGPRKNSLKLSDSLFNTPLRFNDPVSTVSHSEIELREACPQELDARSRWNCLAKGWAGRPRTEIES